MVGPDVERAAAGERVVVSVENLGRTYALARVAAGAGLMSAPRLGGRILGDPTAIDTVRLLGVRDVLLGVHALRSAPGSPSWRRSMALCALADIADAATSLRRAGRNPLGLAVAVTATVGAATGLWIARRPHPAAGQPTDEGPGR
jgi:hypothetical protein